MVVKARRVSVHKVKGADNVSDIGTQIVDGPRFEKLLALLPLSFPAGQVANVGADGGLRN